MPLITTVAEPKGGTGKSTIASNLAIYTELQGYRTLLVDADLQNSSSNWMQRRKNNMDNIVQKVCPEIKNVPGTDQVGILDSEAMVEILEEAIASDEFQFIYIDTGGWDNEILRIAAIYANIVLMPVKANIMDLDTTVNISGIVHKYASGNDDFLGMFFLLNQLPQHGKQKEREISNAREVLSQIASGASIANSIITTRSAFSQAPAYGICVAEEARIEGKLVAQIDKNARNELENLFNELMTIAAEKWE